MVARFFNQVAGTIGGIAGIALALVIPIGSLYWIWTAIQLGSFMMFVAGIVPPFFIVSAPMGFYMLLFGVPGWIVNLFG